MTIIGRITYTSESTWVKVCVSRGPIIYVSHKEGLSVVSGKTYIMFSSQIVGVVSPKSKATESMRIGVEPRWKP